MILGIDEAGRGPWAGPLVVGAVVLGGAEIEGLTDSKKLTKKRRQQLYSEIEEKAQAVGIGWASASEIDELGLGPCLTLATIRAVEQIKVTYHEIIIDGTVNFLKETKKGQYVTTLKKADLLIPAVSAASIMAKVARDNFMSEQDELHPGYGFGSHVGYGTAAHRAAIEKLGVTPLHRLSFAPLQKYNLALKAPGVPASSETTATKAVGDQAETLVAAYLAGLGHEILERNWKTKYCEIDIVSKLNETVYFTEVKYRKSSNQGGGLAAITSSKYKQMTFAARVYAQAKNLHQINLRLAAASVSGEDFKLETWLEID